MLKKIFSVLMLCIFSGVLLTGCGEDRPAPPEVKLGMLKHMNAGEKDFNEFAKKVGETLSLNLTSFDPVFYDSLSAMISGLQSGQVQTVSTYDCVAKYLQVNNPDIELLPNDTLEFIDAFCFAMREDEKDLQSDIDKAIREMQNENVLEDLSAKYIKNVNDKKIPDDVKIPEQPGAPTIKVAVTGDLPPLDYVDAQGDPSGFNVALMAEIAKRIHRNVEFVHIDSGARAAALSSGKVDLIFWAVVPSSQIIPTDADRPEGVILSAPYHREKIMHVKFKK